MLKPVAQLVSWLSLVYLMIPPVLFWLGKLNIGPMQTQMLMATVIWFIATPLWMGREKTE